MKTNMKLYLTLVTCIVFFTACGSKSTQNTQEAETTHSEEEQPEGTVTLTAKQREAISLELGPLQKRQMSSTINVNGELALAPQYEADIGPVMSGLIAEIKVEPGDEISQGEALALLEHPSFTEMQVELQQSSSRLSYLKEEYERQKNLYQKG